MAGIIIETPEHQEVTFEGLWFDNSSFCFNGQPSVWVKDPVTLANFRYNFMSSNGYGGGLRLHSLKNSRIEVRDNEYYDGSDGRGRIVEIGGDATDNDFVGPIHQFRIAGRDTGNTYRDNTGLGLRGARTPVLAKTEDYRVSRGQSGLVLANTGAAAPVVYALPEAEVGLHFTFVKGAAPTLTIRPAGSNTVDGRELGMTNNRETETAASISVLCVQEGRWIVTAQRGTWAHLETHTR
jgi:hypothetical protein